MATKKTTAKPAKTKSAAKPKSAAKSRTSKKATGVLKKGKEVAGEIIAGAAKGATAGAINAVAEIVGLTDDKKNKAEKSETKSAPAQKVQPKKSEGKKSAAGATAKKPAASKTAAKPKAATKPKAAKTKK